MARMRLMRPSFREMPSLLAAIARIEIAERNAGHVRACVSVFSHFRRRDRAGAAGDQAIMFNAAVPREVEDCFLAEHGGIEVARVHQEFVLLGLSLGDDLAFGIDDEAAADQRETVLDAGLGHGYDPGVVLIRSGLHREA